MLRLSTGDELNNLPMPTVEVEVYHEWWEFDTDTFIITDISPPWWDFVMVGICRQAMMMNLRCSLSILWMGWEGMRQRCMPRANGSTKK